jgi:excisionase family DNA binding protein
MTGTLVGPGWFSIREAAERCGVSADTVRRALRAGRFPSAAQLSDGDRGWRISIADLLHAGYRVERNRREDGDLRERPAEPARSSRESTELLDERRELRAEIAALRAENARLREHTLALLDRLAHVTIGRGQ